MRSVALALRAITRHLGPRPLTVPQPPHRGPAVGPLHYSIIFLYKLYCNFITIEKLKIIFNLDLRISTIY